MAEIDYKFISELPSTVSADPGDLFIISQPENSYEYISKKYAYGDLSAQLAGNLSGYIDGRIDQDLSGISSQISGLQYQIDELRLSVEQTISSIIKMANCIQYNKRQISVIFGILCANGLIETT